MSDIDITFPWWLVVPLVLAEWIWPLTAAAAVAAIWLWFQRTALLARIVAPVVIVLWAISAAMSLYAYVSNARSVAADAAELRSRQRTLTQTTVLAGIRLPAGTLVTRKYSGAPDDIQTLDLPRATLVHGIPLIGHVEFDDEHIMGAVTLARDFTIGAIPCSAKASVYFIGAKLASCKLSRAIRIRGIPCRGDINVNVGVECELAADYPRYGYIWRAQTQLQDQGETVWFLIGPLPPNLHVLGSPLPMGSGVRFDGGKISSVNLGTSAVHYRGCAVNMILVQGGTIVGQPQRPCALQGKPDQNIALPSDAVTAPEGVAGQLR